MIEEIKEVLEKHKQHTDKKIEEYKEHTDKKVEEVKRHFDVCREDFDGKVSSIGEQYGSIQENLEIIKNDIEIIKNSLKKKVDIEDFEALEGRVRALESKIK